MSSSSAHSNTFTNFLAEPSSLADSFSITSTSSRKKTNHFLPGFMGSWNKRAIVYNLTVSYREWRLARYIKEYQGILSTLRSHNLLENQDFFSSLTIGANQLRPLRIISYLLSMKLILRDKKKFFFIGHSFGGLVAIIFAQNHHSRVAKVIIVGSPHQGLVQVYKPLSACEIDWENTFLWLAKKIILTLNKSSLEPDRETIRRKLPVLFNLFPIFSSLRNTFGEIIPIDSVSIKNNLLSHYNSSFPIIFDVFTEIVGEKGQNTPAGFVVESANFFNQLVGNYQDGQPRSTFFDWGDETVLRSSTDFDSDSQTLSLDHGEIIRKKEALKKILELLEIEYQENKIVESEKTHLNKSLIFIVKSPVIIQVR